MTNSREIIVVVGPTGIGKTALSLALAEVADVEIISADSRQIYRYLDIGTAKPTAEECAVAPHHFISILDPDQPYSAGEYAKDARQLIDDILKRGNLPLIVGGSGLYVRALLDGFFDEPGKDLELRAALKTRLENEGPEALHAQLAKVDPALAAKTHPNNTRRIVRALEVFELANRPITEIQKQQKNPLQIPWRRFGLNMDREKLYDRINLRVDKMIEAGLVDEIKGILERGYDPDLNSLNTVGYKEIISYFNAEISLDEAVELIKRNSRRYAKRQLTWFRAEEHTTWIDLGSDAGDLKLLAKKLLTDK